MKPYEYDAFGNPVKVTANGQPRAVDLYNGEVYDPALAAYYLRARRHNPMLGRFASPDIHAGEASAPANLQRFGYAGPVPVNRADPG
ncbi:MAG: RHS repeat-associated core domain-containing protein [Tepidisphaeraceae bacterium]